MKPTDQRTSEAASHARARNNTCSRRPLARVAQVQAAAPITQPTTSGNCPAPTLYYVTQRPILANRTNLSSGGGGCKLQLTLEFVLILICADVRQNCRAATKQMPSGQSNSRLSLLGRAAESRKPPHVNSYAHTKAKSCKNNHEPTATLTQSHVGKELSHSICHESRRANSKLVERCGCCRLNLMTASRESRRAARDMHLLNSSASRAASCLLLSHQKLLARPSISWIQQPG